MPIKTKILPWIDHSMKQFSTPCMTAAHVNIHICIHFIQSEPYTRNLWNLQVNISSSGIVLRHPRAKMMPSYFPTLPHASILRIKLSPPAYPSTLTPYPSSIPQILLGKLLATPLSHNCLPKPSPHSHFWHLDNPPYTNPYFARLQYVITSLVLRPCF